MATIKPFIYQGPTATNGQPLPTLSPEQASMLQNVSAQGFQQVSEGYFGLSRKYNSQAQSAMVDYQNTQMRTELVKREYDSFAQTPEILEAIAKGADEQSIYLMKLNEAKRLDDLPGLEKSFMNSSSIKMQEEYLKFIPEAQKNAGPDGTGYIEAINKFFNDSSIALVDSAPSEISKAAMLDRVQQYKLNALGDAIQFESKRRKEWGMQQAGEAANSLVKQAILAPENYSAYMQQTQNLKDNLAQAGVDPSDIEKWTMSAQNEITKGYLHRRINDDPIAALTELGTTDIIDHLDAGDLITNIGKATKAIEERRAEEQKQIEAGQSINRIELGVPLDTNNPSDAKALSTFYEMSTSQLRDPQTGALNQDPIQTSEVLFATLQKTPGAVPPKFKYDFSSAILYGTPESAQAMARLVGRMSSDPKMARTLADLDEKAVQVAMSMNSALSAGTSVSTAFDDARKQILTPATGVEPARSKEADAYLSPEKIAKNLKGEFSSWLAPILGMNEFILGHGYSSEGSKFFDPENLAVANEEYRRLFKQAYVNSGDPDVADKWAKTNLHKSFAVTTVNGKPELMQYAPEIVYPGREKDFKEKFAETSKSAYPDKNITMEARDYFGTNYAQLNGTYPLYYSDADGIKRPLLGKDGVQLTYAYSAGLTPDEQAAIKDMRDRAQAVEDMHKAGYDGLDQIGRLVYEESLKKPMTPEQKYLLEKQLSVIRVGK